MRFKYLLWLVVILGMAFSFSASASTDWIYQDSFQNGWVESGSYDADVKEDSQNPSVYNGSYSLRAIYTVPWGAMRLESTNGGFTAESGGLIDFWFYRYDGQGDPLTADVEVAFFDGSTLVGTADLRAYAGSSIASNQWHHVSIPFTDLGILGQSVSAIEFQSQMTGFISYDDIQLTTGSGGNGGGNDGGDNGGGGNNGGSSEPSRFVYDDTYGSGWTGWMWYNSNVDFTSSAIPAYSGTVSVEVDYTHQPDSLEFHYADGFDPSGYQALQFAINGGANGVGENLSIEVFDGSENYIDSVLLSNYVGDIAPGQWVSVEIPLSAFDGLSGSQIYYLDFFSSSAIGTVYFDDIHFSTSGGSGGGNPGGGSGCGSMATAQVSGYSVSAPPIAPMSLNGGICTPLSGKPSLYFFDETKTPGTQRWPWPTGGSIETVVTEVTSTFYEGSKSLKVEFPAPTQSSNSGVQFYSENSFTLDLGIGEQYVVFAMKGNITASYINIALSKEDGTSVPGAWVHASQYITCTIPYAWCQVVIPMSAFGATGASLPTKSSGFSIESWQGGTMYFDEVRVAGVDFVWPLEGGFDSSKITQNHGEIWAILSYGCDGQRKLHTGIDYGSTQPGDDVRAAFAGTVRVYYSDADWADGLVIENSSQTVTATYLHIDTNLRQGDLVNRGQPIGTIAAIYDDGVLIDHLHFGLRDAPYAATAQRGALPQSDCSYVDPRDVQFPEHFFDPATLEYDSW